MSQQRIYVTHIEEEGPYIKIWGQCDKRTCIALKKSLDRFTNQFDLDLYKPYPAELQVGTMCCAKYKDGGYYRARILSIPILANQGTYKVFFIDFGNTDYVSFIHLHSIPTNSVNLITAPPQAKAFILASVTHVDNKWDNDIFKSIVDTINDYNYDYEIVAEHSCYPLITLLKNGQNVAATLVSRNICNAQATQIQLKTVESMEVSKQNATKLQNPNNKNLSSDRKEKSTYNLGSSYFGASFQSNPHHNRLETVDLTNSAGSSFKFNSEWKQPENKFGYTGFTRPRFNRNEFDTSSNEDPWDPIGSNFGDQIVAKKHKNLNISVDDYLDLSRSKFANKNFDFKMKFKEEPDFVSGDSSRNTRRSQNITKAWGFEPHSMPINKRTSRWSTPNFGPFKKSRIDKKYLIQPDDPAPPNTQFTYLSLAGTIEDVTICWFHNPTYFFCQLGRYKSAFAKLMVDIQNTYAHHKELSHPIYEGAPVIALFPEDNCLYRATVIESADEYGLYKVAYVDFGNTASVDSKIYAIERRHMTLPAQALICSLAGIEARNGKWMNFKKIDYLFNKGTMKCTFETITTDGVNLVSLEAAGKNLQKLLLISGIAVTTSVKDVALEVELLVGQQLRCQLASVNHLGDLLITVFPNSLVKCRMHNIHMATKIMEENLKTLLGKDIIVYVDDHVEKVLEITIYDLLGQKVEVLSPDEGAFDTVDPLCPCPVYTSRLIGYVAHEVPPTDDNPASVAFVQPIAFVDHINQILDVLSEHYDALPELENVEFMPEVEHFYAAKSPNGNWYRAKIESLSEDGDKVTVQYVDFGHKEELLKTNLRDLEITFKEHPCMALEVVMTTTDGKSKKLIDNDVELQLVYGENSWEATLLSSVSQEETEKAIVASEPTDVSSDGDKTANGTKSPTSAQINILQDTIIKAPPKPTEQLQPQKGQTAAADT